MNNTCENCCVRSITDYLFMVICIESNEKCKSISSNTLYFIFTCGHVESSPHVESNFFNYTLTNSLFYLYFYYFILTFFFLSPHFSFLLLFSSPHFSRPTITSRLASPSLFPTVNHHVTTKSTENREESTEKEKKWKREKEIGQNEKRKKKISLNRAGKK